MKTLYPTLCTAALLMLAACTQDPVEDLVSSGNTQSGDLPEGTFIVDYLPSADLPATRDLGEGEAILSLDYLLYASKDNGTTYTLTKHKEISDISANTPWPLTRENMTWAQRQELKDTLSTDSKYKVVFVANADKDKVWPNRKWADNKEFQPMTHVDVKTVTEDGTETGSTFDQARLLLPPNGDFQQTDGTYTFYYMWTGEIDPKTNGYDKNTPAQMNVVLLQRMVNKVEIRLADEVVQGIADAGTEESSFEEKIDAYVTQMLNDYYTEKYANSSFNGELDKAVATYMTTIADKITDVGVSNEEDCKKAFRDNWLKNTEKQKMAVNSISCSENEQKCAKENPCVRHWLINEMKTKFITRCNWTSIQSIEVLYEKANFPQAISFDKKFYLSEDENSNSSLTAIKVADNSYIFYTFGRNENDNNNVDFTKIQSMSFKNNDSEVFSASCNIIPGTNPTGGNRTFTLSYNPITNKETGNKEIAEEAITYQRKEYNLQEALQWNWNEEKEECDFNYGDGVLGAGVTGPWHETDMKTWINGLFPHNENDSYSSDGFQLFTLELKIPIIKNIDTWSTENANQTE